MSKKFYVAACAFTEQYPALATKRFFHGAQGLFQSHTDEEKLQLMREHCAAIQTEKIAAYCHYCVRGLKLGGATTFHLSELLFEEGGQH